MKWLKRLWAGPNTLLGFAALALGGKFVRQSPYGLHYMLELGSPFDLVLKKSQKTAITLGEVVLYRPGQFIPRRAKHECRHIHQYEQWGPFFLPAYLVACVVAKAEGGHPYRDNWFEKDARAHEDGIN